MQKKLFITFAIIVSIVFSFSVCFATDMLTDATNAVKDTMNNAGNAVKDTMNNAGNTMHNSMEKTENTVENAGNKIEGTGNTLEKDVKEELVDKTHLVASAFEVRYLPELPRSEAGKVLYSQLINK